MKHLYLFAILLISLPAFATEPSFVNGSDLAFIPNEGQYVTDAGQPAGMVHFRADVAGLEFYITDDGLSYVFVKHNHDEYDPALGGEPDPDFQTTTDFARVDMVLKNASIDPDKVLMEKPASSLTNYYYAHCPNGLTGIQGYHKITYKEVYNNIDWVIYSDNGQLKYEFIVRPGGNPADIQLEYKWADLQVNTTDIMLSTPMGQISDQGLYAYVLETGDPVAANFVQNGNTVSVNTLAPAGQTLVIDPALEWSTYWGGSGAEQPQALVASGTGFIFVAGYTNSTTYPTYNAGGGAYFQGTFAGGYDAFTAKFDTSGVLYWSTYYGGSGSEGSTSYTGISIACGAGSDFWMVGTTNSTNLPVQNPGGGAYYQGTNAGGDDLFIVKFDINGVRQYATYMGGSSSDGGTSHGNGADCDLSGNLYFSARMLSTNFPWLNPGGGAYFDNTQNGGDDLCIVKMSPTGQLLWSTILGGSGDDMNYSMDLHVDRINSKLYIGTCTRSTNIPTWNPGGGAYYDGTQNGAGDMYLARFSLTGVPEWGTFVGGSGDEWLAMSVNSAPDGDVAMITLTGSTNMPLVNPGGGAFHDPSHNGGTWDMYLCRFETNGMMSWSTYYGSSNNDHCQHNLTMDANGNIIMAGVSDGTAPPPTYNPGAPHFYDGTKDAQGTYCLVQYDPAGIMLWGTYWGGSGHDHLFGTVGGCIGVSAHSDIFFSAETTSPDLPMLNPGGGAFYKSTNSGSKEGFVAKFNNDIIPVILNVDLLSFTGKHKDHGNELNWMLANGDNAAHFIVEREINGSFEPLAAVQGTGSLSYSFTDQAPLEGHNYYRLKMFDQNGNFTYSNVVEIRDAGASVDVDIYPNPATDRVTVNLQSDGAAVMKVTIADVAGRIVYSEEMSESGKWTQDVSSWASGTYFFTVSETESGKVVYRNKLVVK